ncbi:hypothetical protein D915_009108 [Fasciola hepatica]|uniref:Uncharacterized protein n=1 Tax=Fasciola hepatica TaxID=6192 RepID=A0A4E0QYL6_FASHE|nr:hypothetical protein D915_009108 [Fasciola hepatica]
MANERTTHLQMGKPWQSGTIIAILLSVSWVTIGMNTSDFGVMKITRPWEEENEGLSNTTTSLPPEEYFWLDMVGHFVILDKWVFYEPTVSDMSTSEYVLKQEIICAAVTAVMYVAVSELSTAFENCTVRITEGNEHDAANGLPYALVHVRIRIEPVDRTNEMLSSIIFEMYHAAKNHVARGTQFRDDAIVSISKEKVQRTSEITAALMTTETISSSDKVTSTDMKMEEASGKKDKTENLTKQRNATNWQTVIDTVHSIGINVTTDSTTTFPTMESSDTSEEKTKTTATGLKSTEPISIPHTSNHAELRPSESNFTFVTKARESQSSTTSTVEFAGIDSSVSLRRNTTPEGNMRTVAMAVTLIFSASIVVVWIAVICFVRFT